MAQKKLLIRSTSINGSVHSFSQTEVSFYANHLNHCIGDDAMIQYLMPINPNNLDLLNKVADGVLIAQFINHIHPESKQNRRIHYPRNGRINQHHIIENHNINLQEAKALGIRLHNVSAEDLRDAERNPTLVLGLIWQLVKAQFLSTINSVGNHKDEILAESLIRWVNHHLKLQHSHRKMHNFGSDLKDAEIYTILLASIGEEEGCDLEPLKWDIPRRVQEVLESASMIGCHPFLTVDDIMSENSKFNMIFVAQLFETVHANAKRVRFASSTDVKLIPHRSDVGNEEIAIESNGNGNWNGKSDSVKDEELRDSEEIGQIIPALMRMKAIKLPTPPAWSDSDNENNDFSL